MVKILGFSEEKIKRVEEALAKYATVEEAVEEIRKLNLEGYMFRHKSDKEGDKQK